MQKRTKGIARLLALSLLFSGLPITPAYATEILESDETAEVTEPEASAEAEEEEAVEPEASAEADAPVELDESTEAEEPLQSEENVSVPAATVKMAGSDGVFYDDVLYLSVKNVTAMDERLQARYRRLCDEIAAAKNGGVEIEDAVFAMDADGSLHCSYSVSMRGLDVICAEMTADLEEAPVLHLENGETDLPVPVSEPEQDEASPVEEEEKTEKNDETSPAEGEDAEEKEDGTSPAEGEDAEEKEDGTSPAEGEDEAEKKDETSPGEEEDEAEKEDEVSPAEGENESEIKDESEKVDETSLDVGEGEAEITVFEENMERLSRPEAKTFEAIEPVRLADLDLGYGGDGADSVQVCSLLSSEDYFREQLTDIQKVIYDAAEDTLTKGMTQFTVTVQDPSEIEWDDMTRAVSALMLVYPAETDWMRYCPDRSYGMNYDIFEEPSGWVEKMVVTFGVSDFYSSLLEQRAQEKVKEVGQLAVQYAVENYPDVLTYGVVKYLDQWVCENGYYNAGGGPAIFNEPNPTYEQREIYYKCHTAYGILLEGYGVCEGYAKTMSRLLDAVGIPNLFITGDWYSGGKPYGHAWNYVQMPNGSWYLLDSTYNDNSGPPSNKKSNMRYLLIKDDRKHVPIGEVLHLEGKANFTFPTLAGSNYDSGSEYDADSDYGSGNGTIILNQAACNMIPRQKETLTYTIAGDWDYSKTKVVWSSSDTKVAKVDQKGVVTAVAPGTAAIFLTASGMAAECKITVDQVKAMKSENTGKTSENVSLGIDGEKKEQKTIALTVDMGKSPHTAEWMIAQGKAGAPQIVSPKPNVTVSAPAVSGNRIEVTLQAVSQGNVNVSVKFAGKTVTLKTAAGQLIKEEMFNVTWPQTVREEGSNRITPYTGKAIKPVVKKKPDAQYKAVRFKTTYVHNKDAGTAKVLITGTGAYGGTIEYPFIITPIDITDADFSKTLKSKVYSGGPNPPATVVKWNRKTLKAGRDYEILYNDERESDIREQNGGAIPAGSYTITINGIGNYTGKVSRTQNYTVTQNTIAKVSVTGAGSAKYTGMAMQPYTVKIGRNVLPGTDYKITWYRGQGKKRNAVPMKSAPTAKGKFTAVITVEGSNLTVTNKKKEIVKNFTIK